MRLSWENWFCSAWTRGGEGKISLQSAAVLEKSREEMEALWVCSNTRSNFPEMLWNLYPWGHSEPDWTWLRATSSRWMYSEKEVGLGELQGLLSTKIILFLSDFFSSHQPCQKHIQHLQKQLRKKKKRLLIWGFVLLFVQAQKLVQINRYLPSWKKTTGKKPENPWWRLFRFQNSLRESQEINCLKLSSHEWGGSGKECCIRYKW